jgi:hypothetical protein
LIVLSKTHEQLMPAEPLGEDRRRHSCALFVRQ